MALTGKNIILGITGGIAAYKSADLTRRLRESGAEVRVVMTRSATEFVTPLTFQALSGNPVHTGLLDPDAEAAMGHIELARWADAVLVAPATADFIARLAHGMADDLLSTLCLATEAPIALAPAMNRVMWCNPATQDNVELIIERGIRLFGPGAGSQACGETGEGRMLEPTELVAGLAGVFRSGVLAGINVLITAGPTREPLDPVRYITNRSSGRMGFALAQAAVEAGAKVRLVSGPVTLPSPQGLQRIDVETAVEMRRAVKERAGDTDIFIACAAVADFRPGEVANQKIKRAAHRTTLALTENPDIVAEVATLQPRPFIVGFAAETNDLKRNALKKLSGKGLDMIAANAVGSPGLGFESQDNALEVFWPGGQRSFAKQRKYTLAQQLLHLIAERYAANKDCPGIVTLHCVQGRNQDSG